MRKKTSFRCVRALALLFCFLCVAPIVWACPCWASYDVIRITDNTYDDRSPRINNRGEVAWAGYDGADDEVFLYDGTGTIQLTDNSRGDNQAEINDEGKVVWRSSGPSWHELFLFDGFSVRQLTNDGGRDDYEPKISDSGFVAWTHEGGWYGEDLDIRLYDGSSIRSLNSNPNEDHAPWVNNNGHVVWIANMDLGVFF